MRDRQASCEIVRADARHLDVLAPLFDAYRVFYRQPSDPDLARAFVRDRLGQTDACAFFLASRAREPAGFTRMWLTYSSIAARPAWILEDLYVVGSARRSGVASALLRRCAQHARESDAVVVSLETARDNTAAQRLYEASGYVREDAFVKYNLIVAR
jgi:ribosomal protein S18 acetylase RimI-like enzyme